MWIIKNILVQFRVKLFWYQMNLQSITTSHPVAMLKKFKFFLVYFNKMRSSVSYQSRIYFQSIDYSHLRSYLWSLPVPRISNWATEFRPSVMNVTLTYKSEIIFYHGPRSEVNRKPVFLFEVHLLDQIKLCLFVKMNYFSILKLF